MLLAAVAAATLLLPHLPLLLPLVSLRFLTWPRSGPTSASASSATGWFPGKTRAGSASPSERSRRSTLGRRWRRQRGSSSVLRLLLLLLLLLLPPLLLPAFLLLCPLSISSATQSPTRRPGSCRQRGPPSTSWSLPRAEKKERERVPARLLLRRRRRRRHRGASSASEQSSSSPSSSPPPGAQRAP